MANRRVGYEVAQLLTVLKDKCAHDKKSVAVRTALVEGLMVILANASTHHTMEVVLPEIGPNLLHDRSPIVRATFANLLETIASCRAIPTQHVVPHEELSFLIPNALAATLADFW